MNNLNYELDKITGITIKNLNTEAFYGLLLFTPNIKYFKQSNYN